MKTFLAATLALGTLGIVSCGSDTKKKVQNEVRAPSLQEDWSGGCEALGGVLPFSSSVNMRFDALAFSRTLSWATDAGCKTNDVEIVYSGEYKIGEANDAQKAIAVSPIDFTYKTVTLKPLTEGGVTVLNGLGFCDHTDYAVGIAVDLSAVSTVGSCPLLDVPQFQYDIVSTEGGILRFGATGVKDAPVKPEERPTALTGLMLNQK